MRASEAGTVVVVEDDPSMSQALTRILRLGGIAARSYVSAEAWLASDGFTDARCLIVDVQLPEMNGFELRHRLATMGPVPPVIFITAFDSAEARAQALAAGAIAFLPKPFAGRTLLEMVRRVLGSSESPRRDAVAPLQQPRET